MAKERSESRKEDCWDLNPLFKSVEDWRNALKKMSAEKGPLDELATYKGRLAESEETLRQAIELQIDIDRKISNLYVYAHLRHDEDLANQENKALYDQALHLYFNFQNISSFMEPEILQIEDSRLSQFLNSDKLAPYKLLLEKVVRLKPHTLSSDKEHLMALASKALHAPSQIFSAYNNADLTFESIKDEEGKEHELSIGLYSLHMQSKDRTLRKNAFTALHEGYKKFENTVAEMLSGHVQMHIFNAKSRGYSSCLEAALFPNQIDPKVYRALIDTVKENIKVMHDYVSFRKDFMQIDKVHGYDMYVSCAPSFNFKMDFDEAVNTTIDAVEILGKDYQETLRKGLTEQRWVDRYENARKRSGAYSSGSYDSHPYILMNYHGTLNDVMTLAHEAGHSMHSYYSDKTQSYPYAQYSIFVAEVASTFNEELLFRHLLKNARDENEKLYLINQKIDGIRATLFRQTLFAEFELLVHELAEKGAPLTVSTLKELYKNLNKEYYGEDFCHDDHIQYEFLRIPHFYSNFYVYQYATGIAAALDLAEQVTKTKDPSKYLKFLSSGSSDYPVSLLKTSGVDMLSKHPVQTLINRFDELTKEFKRIRQVVKKAS